jgi:transcription-repair coupling factor (superfamily II helicase)
MSFSLARQLENAPADVPRILAALSDGARSDLSELPPGALAFAIAAAVRAGRGPFLLVVADGAMAARLEADVSFFLGPERAAETLSFPAIETTPFVDIAPDRRVAMDRLATLFQLAQGASAAVVVAPIGALLRKVPPATALRRASAQVAIGDRLDRSHLLDVLGMGGYLRVPLVEDPGTFAVRGAIVDVYPPRSELPVRIELDDDLVASLKSFSPEDQRTQAELESVLVHPVRDALLGPEELLLAKERVSDLCDAAGMPSSKRRQIVEDIGTGRTFIGLEAYLPAFYAQLDTLFDYLPKNTRVVAFDPPALARALTEDLERAAEEREARIAQKAPTFALDAHYVSTRELQAVLEARALTAVHTVAFHGAPADEEPSTALDALEPPAPDELVRAGASDQAALASELHAARVAHAEDTLLPLAHWLRRVLDEGMHVVLTARALVQAERLAGLLRGYDLPIDKPGPLDWSNLRAAPRGRVQLAVGPLESGFMLPSALLACVTEEEIFGSRKTRRSQRKESRRNKGRAFVADLRELSIGDYVVHVDHGVGVYRGLSLGEIPVSRMEALQGMRPKRVEVLIVEYGGGDRLFLPVTRLNLIEKLASKEGGTPKLDKLGGTTFARTKARVRESVRQLADDLLALYAARAARQRPHYPARDRMYAQFEARFPYEETADQGRAIDDVMSDLDGDKPMDRLVCGDVGFGKTEVALRAAFRVAMAGRQVAILCPTTVLAQQHLRTFEQRVGDYPIKIEMLSRFVDKKQQTETLARLKDGTCDIVIGTHRLLSKDVHFARLGLLVVDEEQRFGVTHKERIKKLKTEVDVLTLSATPIPRTLHMALGGLRELSLITTPPTDRRAVRTFITRWDDQVIRDAVQREILRGGQVFFIHNRIDGLYERAARLQELVPTARIAVAHGKLNEVTLERVMSDFVEGNYDVLASTAIVENGLDIPRANTILIDRADMFGLSQLYQLRGRVGRSRERAYCYLIAPPPNVLSDEARTRIEALERFNQLGAGFQVASLDLELRGAGDLLGDEQSGNVAAVGFDLFVHMLEEAIAELRGQTLETEVDPELTLDVEHYIPDDYVADVGVRLSLYKRFAAAESEDAVDELATEMEDRFGKPPAPALELVRAMALKPRLRALRVLGCEATGSRVAMHFKDDTPLDAAVLARVVAKNRGYTLTPDMKLIARFDKQAGEGQVDGIARATAVLDQLTQKG